MNLIIIPIALIGVALILAPFIGLAYDLKKSRKYLTAIIFLGLCFLVPVMISQISNLSTVTLVTFSLVPALFLFVFLQSKFPALEKKGNQLKEDTTDI